MNSKAPERKKKKQEKKKLVNIHVFVQHVHKEKEEVNNEKKKKEDPAFAALGLFFMLFCSLSFSKRGNKQPYHNSKIKLVTSIDAVANSPT